MENDAICRRHIYQDAAAIRAHLHGIAALGSQQRPGIYVAGRWRRPSFWTYRRLLDLRLSSSCSCVPWVMVASERAGGGRSTKAAQGRPSGGRATTGERDLDGVSRENERHDHHTLRALTREDYHVEKVRDVAAVVRLPQRWVKKFIRRRQLRRNRGSPPGVFDVLRAPTGEATVAHGTHEQLEERRRSNRRRYVQNEGRRHLPATYIPGRCGDPSAAMPYNRARIAAVSWYICRRQMASSILVISSPVGSASFIELFVCAMGDGR